MILATQAAAKYYGGRDAETIFTKGEVVASGYDGGYFNALVKYRREYYHCNVSVGSSGLKVHWCRGEGE